jgi:hypothetical protein
MTIRSQQSSLFVLAIAFLGALSCLNLTGCGVDATATVAAKGVALHGSVHGGQQPVTGANMALYAASTTGYGQPYVYAVGSSLLGKNVAQTDNTGSFSITGDYSCPTQTTEVYLVATQGNPGLAPESNNAGIALMAALGPCGQLTAATHITINELTTVASVWALSPFMASINGIGSSPANVQGLTNAFNNVNKIVNISSGQLGGPSLAAGASLPTPMLYTLANILAACINSAGGVAGDKSACGNLYTATTVNGVVPSDTITAAMNIAQHPGAQVAALFAVPSADPPFQPALSAAPTSFAVVIRYSSASLSNPSGIAVDAAGQVWVPNSGNDTVTALNQSGSPVSGSPFSGNGLDQPAAVGVDANGNAWIANRGGNSLSSFTRTGQIANPLQTAGALNLPSSVAIDASGNIWVANYGSASVSEFTGSGGVAASFSLTAPPGSSIAIDPF